jgi:hypothetical protein
LPQLPSRSLNPRRMNSRSRNVQIAAIGIANPVAARPFSTWSVEGL